MTGVFAMTLRIALVALCLSLVPGLAAAKCFGERGSQSAATCAEGQVWDADSETCIAPVTG
jgi:hypothetical protein